MKLFIPGYKDEDIPNIIKLTYADVWRNTGFYPDKSKLIYSITKEITELKNKQYKKYYQYITVGENYDGKNEKVMIIFVDDKRYFVCTDCRGFEGSEPIVITKNASDDVQYFEGETIYVE